MSTSFQMVNLQLYFLLDPCCSQGSSLAISTSERAGRLQICNALRNVGVGFSDSGFESRVEDLGFRV